MYVPLVLWRATRDHHLRDHLENRAAVRERKRENELFGTTYPKHKTQL